MSIAAELIKFEIRKVASLPNAYVSAEGTVYRRDRKSPNALIPIKPHLSKVGYHVVNMNFEPRRSKPFYVHRLVAETFHPKPEGAAEVRHLDGTRLNNAASNLTWGTRKQNVADMRLHGRMQLGENVKSSVLSNHDVQIVRYLLDRGASLRAIAHVFGVGSSAVAAIRDGKTWSHLSHVENTLAV